MRRLLSVFVVALLVVGLASVVDAAPLKWEGTLRVDLGTLPTSYTTGTGFATVNESLPLSRHLNRIRLGPGLTATTIVPVTDPEVTQGPQPIVAVSVSITNVTGTLSPSLGSGSIGTLPVRGVARICEIDPACVSGGIFPVNLTTTGHTAASSTSGGVGIGGLITIGDGSDLRISIQANPWTLGTGTALDETDSHAIVTVTSMGFAHGPASLTSSTVATGGVVKFITPLQVTTNITSGSSAIVSAFTTLKLRFVPEPGMLLLLGSGVVGLVLLGRHRMKK